MKTTGAAVMALVLLIIVVNLALGFAAAMALGYGPPGAAEIWLALSGETALRRAPPVERPASPPAESPAPPAALLPDATPEQLTGMLDMDDVAAELAPLAEAYDDDAASVAELLNPGGPENWDLNEKYVETSILKLNVAMMKSGARATQIDTRLREARGKLSGDVIAECVGLLKEDCEAYLAEQAAAADKLRARIDELGDLKSLGEEIETTNLEQAAQVETTLSNLTHMDLASDPEAAGARLLQEICLLRAARHRLRDSQEVAFLTVARCERRLDKIEPELFADPLTRLRNRIGLETMLWTWWQEGRPASRQMSAVLMDVDRFGKLNEIHGSLAGDKILYQLAQLIQGGLGPADLVGRFAGQQFLVVFLDVGPRTAIRNAEFLRQSIEKTTYIAGAKTMQVTVAAGVTDIKPADTFEQVVQRLEAALKQAKHEGGNQAWLHTGKDAELIESPNLGAQPKEIVI